MFLPEAIIFMTRHLTRHGACFAPASEEGTGLPEPRRVLVVEDNYFVGLQIEQTLKNAGFDVVGIAANAEEAIALSTETLPHFVMMDIRLAGASDGITTALYLFRETGLRSIFVTAHSDEATRARAHAAHPLGWIAKPFTPEQLIAAVRHALAQADQAGHC